MQDDLRHGLVLMLAATVLFSSSDTMAKYVTESVPGVELAFIRYVVFVAMAAVPVLRRRPSLRSRRPVQQVLRGLGVVGSAIAFILSLGSLPIAEATAVNFVTPLLITVLAVPVLGEVVRPQGWAAVLVGFVGMLVVVRPGLHGFHPAAGLVVLSSACWCVGMLVTRRMGGAERSDVTLLWTALTGLLVLTAALPFYLQALTARQLALCVTVGIVASGGQWCALLAYRRAPASVLAPLGYAQLIWSSLLGWAVFGALPDRWVVVGALVIAASGSYVVRMERRRVSAAIPPCTAADASSRPSPTHPRTGARALGAETRQEQA